MAYETFTWCPQDETEGRSEFRVLSTQFGDGYRQEVGDGINNEERSWPLLFAGYESEIKPVRDFLRRHSGFKPFRWMPPMETEHGLFVVREFSLKPMGGRFYTLTVTFEERFAP